MNPGSFLLTTANPAHDLGRGDAVMAGPTVTDPVLAQNSIQYVYDLGCTSRTLHGQSIDVGAFAYGQ
jgi:hypothetical protein